jgi:hypothetical protein
MPKYHATLGAVLLHLLWTNTGGLQGRRLDQHNLARAMEWDRLNPFPPAGKMPRLPALPSRRLPIDVAKRFAGVPSYDRPKGIRVLGEPEPGYFKLRQARKGPWVPAIIWRPCPLILPEPWRSAIVGATLLLEETPGPEDWCVPTERARPLRARIGDKEASPFEVWERGREIELAEYSWRLALREWAVAYAPAQPEANPRKSADLAKLPSLF